MSDAPYNHRLQSKLDDRLYIRQLVTQLVLARVIAGEEIDADAIRQQMIDAGYGRDVPFADGAQRLEVIDESLALMQGGQLRPAGA